MINLTRAWAAPRGVLGRLAGWEMAVGRGDFDDRLLEVMELPPGSHVLEIGCGPGVTLERLLARDSRAMAVGVDPSTAMLAQAQRRNRAAITAGRLELCQANAEQLPFESAAFDRALTVNSLPHWDSAPAGLSE